MSHITLSLTHLTIPCMIHTSDPSHIPRIHMTTPVSITLHNLTLQTTLPYSEGQPLTSAEADALNSLWLERVRSSFGKKVKEWMPESGDWSGVDSAAVESLQREFAEYTASYRIGGVSPNVIAREARVIARAALMAGLNAQGRKIDDLEDAEEQIKRLAASPQVLAEARSRIANLQTLGQGLLREVV